MPDQHVGATDDLSGGLDLVGADLGCGDLADDTDELDHLVDRHAGVDDQIVACRTRRALLIVFGFSMLLLQRSGQRAPQEVLLAGDASEIG